MVWTYFSLTRLAWWFLERTMSKLFDKRDQVQLTLSHESMAARIQSAQVLSLEAVSDYLARSKDLFGGVISQTYDVGTDKAALEATSRRHEVLSILKRLHFSALAEETVTKPEKFQGKYKDYLHDLISVCDKSVPDTIELLNALKMAISGFMNEYSEDGVVTIYGSHRKETSSRLTDQGLGALKVYFPEAKATFKARVKDVLKNLGDVESLFNDVKKLDAVCNFDTIKKIQKLAKEVSEMVDLLIEQNTKTGLLLNNDSAKKELMAMIDVAAHSVSFVGYLYANTLYLYNALKSLSEKIVEVGNR